VKLEFYFGANKLQITAVAEAFLTKEVVFATRGAQG
jgi:hypothetical protein